MIRALPAPLAIPWPHVRLAVLFAAYVTVNLLLVTIMSPFPGPADWDMLWSRLPSMIGSGDLYQPQRIPFVWSPVAAWLLVPVALAGPWMWGALHFASLALLRDWRLIALVLVSWAFWSDVTSAGVMTFVVVLGFLSLSGQRWAQLAYLILFLLVPRPVQVPLAVWLVVSQPWLRLPFLAIFLAHAGLVGLSGYAAEWIGAALLQVQDPPLNLAPTFWIGAKWLVVAWPLALLFLVLRRFGLASVLASPYLLPGYLLVLLWEVRRDRLA